MVEAWIIGGVFLVCSSRGGGVDDEMRVSSELSKQLQYPAHQHSASLLQLAQRQVEHSIHLAVWVGRRALCVLFLLSEQLVLRDHLLEVVATDAEIAQEILNHELQLFIDTAVATLLHDLAQAVHRCKP